MLEAQTDTERIRSTIDRYGAKLEEKLGQIETHREGRSPFFDGAGPAHAESDFPVIEGEDAQTIRDGREFGVNNPDIAVIK